jgi:uncharacterized protein (TIGR02145 family)
MKKAFILILCFLNVFTLLSQPQKKTPQNPNQHPGAQVSQPEIVKDIDGNIYHTVKIGTQEWLVENLKVTKYNDGTPIPQVKYNSSWNYLQTPGYYWYNNDSAGFKETYGALYNWYAVGTGKLAPKGWHVATFSDWIILKNFVTSNPGKSKSEAKALASDQFWKASKYNVDEIGFNMADNNSSGFTGLPGGLRGNGEFIKATEYAFWWSATPTDESKAWQFSLTYDYYKIDSIIYYKGVGMSVRCIKD